MAVPTITNITPAEGLTRGRTWVLITGTNFATRTVGEGADPKVAVTFGGESATDVREEAATRLTCLTPAVDPGAVDVVVTNLDAPGGDPVPGESATEADGYEYKRPDLTVTTNFTHVLTKVIEWLARDVIANVLRLTHTEYDAATGDAKSIAEHAKLPVLVLVGPRCVRDEVYGVSGNESEQDDPDSPTTFASYRAPLRWDMEFEVVAAARTDRELFNLAHHASVALEITPELPVLSDPSDPASDVVRYDLDLLEPFDMSAQRPMTSDVRSATARFVVRGVTVSDGETLEAGPVLQQGVDDLVLTMTAL